jgi:ATP-dependent helicase/nuclease subunit A
VTSRALKAAEDAQLIAADPARSVFVTANAGSGKTKVLIDRIARLLLAGSKPSAFLCITYTKAAAAEMQRRLFERLGGWCVADDSKLAADLSALGAPSGNAARARALFAQALETPGGLKIQTIHAFCERLLARFPLEAGVPPGFEIADDARAAALLGQARADAALSPDAPVEAFRRFAGKLSGDALDALMDRLAWRRAAFHRFAQSCPGPIFAAAALRKRHDVRQSADAFARDFLARQDWPTLRRAIGVLAESGRNDQAAGERLRAIMTCIERNVAAPLALASCFDFAFTGNGEPYKKLVTAQLAKDQPWLAPALQEFAAACVDAREKLNAIERAEDAVAALALALKLDQAYTDAKERGGVLDFDDLIEKARNLLGLSEAAPWVLYKLDGGLDHILIDEGQDTSPGQWDLIAPLQDEFFAGKGARVRARTIFAVGDPKQSIYGFQGADPQRFLSEARALDTRARQAGLPFAAPDLLTSFRSAPEILRAVDATFATLPLVDGPPGSHDVVEHLAFREHEPGSVEVWPVAMRPPVQPAQAWDAPMDVESGVSAPAILARELALRVKAMIAGREGVWEKGALRPLHAGDVLALVRKRGVLFRELIKAFKRTGLPVAGADRMVLRDELAVEDALALMRAALDPAADLSLACVLKGPWIGLDDDDADIFPLAHGRARGETLLARLCASSEEKYAHARAFVSALGARKGEDAFAFLSWALDATHAGETGWSRVLTRLGAEARDPLEELLQRALKPGAHHAATLQRFLHEIDADSGQVKRELEAEGGAVRVMTVHGAKGLEAPLVILPDSTGEIEDAPENGLIFDDEAGPFVSFRGRDDDVKVAAARAAHEARAASEHWRLLYVAMTRARDRLIVCGAQFGNAATGEARDCWRAAVEAGVRKLGASAGATPFGEGLLLGAPHRAEASEHTAMSAPPPPAWARTAALHEPALAGAAPSHAGHAEPAPLSPRASGRQRFSRGRLIHGLLERLPDVAREDRLEAARRWLARRGVAEADAALYAREAVGVIESLPSVFGLMSRAEAPIVGTIGGKAISGIVDRLAVDNDSVTVLDFKTDRPAPVRAEDTPSAYVLQLSLYRAVLAQIFPAKAVACAIVWTEAPLLVRLPERLLDEALEAFLRG